MEKHRLEENLIEKKGNTKRNKEDKSFGSFCCNKKRE